MIRYFALIPIVFLFSLLCTASADGKKVDRFSLDLNANDEGKVNPDIFLPIYWSESFFSGIGFSNSASLSQGTLSGFSDSRIGTSIDQRDLAVNLISYQSQAAGFSYSVGGNYKLNSIDRTEFGYFRLNNGLVDDYVAFDNIVEIGVSGLALRGDMTWGEQKNKHQFRISAVISPKDDLDVDQTTSFKPIITTASTGNSSKSQDVGYDLKLQTLHKMTKSVSIGFQLQYQILPLDYDLQVLTSTATSFQNATIDTTETTISYSVRLIIADVMLNGMSLVLGVGSENVETKDNLSGGTTNEDGSIVTVGFTGNF